MRRRFFLTTFALAAIAAGSAEASVDVTITQSGANVVLAVNGTVDTTDLSFLGTMADNANGVVPAAGDILLTGPGGQTGMTELSLYGGLSGPGAFGTGGLDLANSVTGDVFSLINEGRLEVPLDYVSGAEITATATFDHTTLAGLGVTDGTYYWTWGAGAGADFVRLEIGAPVPEPATLPIMLSAALGVVIMRRGRNTKA